MLAWPTVLANMLHNLATTVDMIMVGRLGAAQIASVGFSAMIYWFLCTLVMGVEVAITAIVARNVGAGRPGDANYMLGQAIVIGLGIGVLVGTAAWFLSPNIFRLFGVEQDVFVLSVPYLRIMSICLPFFSLVVIISGALRGAGDTKTPMYVGAVATVIHVSVNYILIFGKFGMPALGVRGAALGSLISFGIELLLLLYLLFGKRLVIRLGLKDFKIDQDRIMQIIRLAVPASGERIVMNVGLLLYAKFIVSFGTLALSGYQVGMQVLSLSFIPNDAFAIAAGTLVGQNLGAGRKEEAKRAGWICLGWALVAMGVLAVVFLGGARLLASIFVSDPEVIRIAASFIKVVAICQVGMAVYFTLSGALRGAGDTKTPLYVTLLGMYGCRIPGVIIFTKVLGWGVTAAFSIMIFDYIIRVIAITIKYQKGKWLETQV